MKAERGRRILVDIWRNGYGVTFAAPYAVRAKPGAPHLGSLHLGEVERGDAEPQTFTLRSMADRIEAVGDLWSGMRRRGRSLRRPVTRLQGMLGADRENEGDVPAV